MSQQVPTVNISINDSVPFMQNQVHNQMHNPMQYQVPPHMQQPMYPYPMKSRKSKTAAGILAILLGWIGIHKFYLGKTGMGILYLLFFWTYIPGIIGIVEGIIYLTSTDEKFYSKYVMK